MNNKYLFQVIASLSLISGYSSASQAEPPRGQDVQPLASHCNIGPFPQVGKAGEYNQLCNVMEDSEKCLALIKGAFHYDGQDVTVTPLSKADRGKYCLQILKKDLGLSFEE